MIPKIELLRIKRIISNGEASGLTPDEILINIDGIRPPKIEYKEKPTVSSKEQLEYMRIWRIRQKEIKKMKEEQDKKDVKIKKALERVSFFCYFCKKSVKVSNPSNNKALIIQKKNRRKKQINVSNICPFCLNKLNSYGGLV